MFIEKFSNPLVIASTIGAYRQRLGLSRAELAGKLDVTERTVRNWEDGDNGAPLMALLAVAALYHRLDEKI